MAKQRVQPGGTIDAVTHQELEEFFTRLARPRALLSLGGGTLEQLMDDMPVRGMLRHVTSFHRGDGNDNFVVPVAAYAQMLGPEPARIAGSVINIGANPAFVYLNTMDRVQNIPQGTVQGMPVGYLFANGGTWDFKLSNEVWCGPVTIYSVLGTTLVWGTH